MSDSYISVVIAESVTCGTLLGPLPLNSGAPDSLAVLTWRCVDKLPTAKQVLRVTLREQANGRCKPPAWISHILPARNPEEQTLEVIVKAGQLYFRALRDINNGEELRAWFGQDLADILKLPMIPPITVEDGKQYECMLCQEQFENPFPVVAHLMYRCRRKDQGITVMQNPFRKKNGGRVKNFDIATLTDMNDNDSIGNDDNSPILNVTTPDIGINLVTEGSPQRQLDNSQHRKRRVETLDECSSSPKKSKSSISKNTDEIKVTQIKTMKSTKSHNNAFKLTSSPTISEYSNPLHSNVDINSNESNSSAFKKVDKSSTAFHSNISSIPNLFPPTLDPRDILFQGGSNSFTPFSYTVPSVANSSPSASLSQNGTSGVPHSILTSTPVEVHMTSAFAPNSKLSTTVSSSTGPIHQQLKMAEEYKVMRKIPNLPDSYELSTLLPAVTANGSRMPGIPTALNYAPKAQSLESFTTAKTFPTPLLPFLPPSLAALSFPTQNWCAKCNASFRMTSDLVYHMRSHHKRETDPQKLKREEKLRCHICNETFRERHHLTRHMTSHQ